METWFVSNYNQTVRVQAATHKKKMFLISATKEWIQCSDVAIENIAVQYKGGGGGPPNNEVSYISKRMVSSSVKHSSGTSLRYSPRGGY